MFEKLKQRWKVNGLNLLLIIVTFALGGSLCGYTGRALLSFTSIERGVIWVFLYILLITLLWPVAVLLVSIPLGQFGFFKKYIVKIFGRFGNNTVKDSQTGSDIINLAIFASGAGSNAQQLIDYFANAAHIKIALIVCNKPGAGVIHIANHYHIPVQLIEKEPFFNGDHYLPVLRQHNIHYIILAGFLWKIPAALVGVYPQKIVNIHPALLPKYGGKGMYGHHVHEAVISNREKESGITIHYVDELYDHGTMIFQATCPVTENDNAATLATKIHALEHRHFPAVVAELLQKQNRS